MAVALVQVERPEERREEDLVLAPAVGRFAECVVCVEVSAIVWTGDCEVVKHTYHAHSIVRMQLSTAAFGQLSEHDRYA